MRKLANWIEGKSASSKADLPWLKLATFGNDRSLSPSGYSYRCNANVTSVTGLEGDYDAERMTPGEARIKLAKSGIAAFLYTTASHTPEAPRWRVFCPFSGPLPPEAREVLMARLNGVLGGVLAPESFTLSLAYYAGNVEGGQPVKTYLVEGDYIDKVEGLKPIYRNGGKTKPERGKSKGEKTGLPFAEVRDALMSIPNNRLNLGLDDRLSWLRIGMALHHETDGNEEGRNAFHDWSSPYPTYSFDKTEVAWDSFTDDRDAGVTGATILWGARKHGWRNLALEDRLLDECWTPEQLEAIAQEALDLETKATIEELVGTPPDTAYFKPASAWADLPIPPRKWHVEDLIPGNTVTMLGGDGGTGKSLLALQLAVATATGSSWIGRDIDEPGKALVLSAEDDDEELQRRVAAICEAQGLPRSSLGEMLIRSTAGEDSLLAELDGKANRLKATKIYKTICAEMKREKPALLILDTLADLHAGNENDRAHARQFIGLLRHLAIEYQCAVLLLAHPSLTGMNSGTGLSGSTAWNASVRSRLYLKRVKDDGYEADPDARTLETMKANYGPTGGTIGLTWVNGVFAPDLPGEGREERNAKAERVFLSLLAEFTNQGRRVSPNNGVTLASKVFAEHPGSEGVSKKAFKAAMEKLLDAGRITVEEDGPPSKRRQYLARGLL